MSDDKLAAAFYPDRPITLDSRTMVPMKFGAYVTSSMRAQTTEDVFAGHLLHRLECMVLSDTTVTDTYEGRSRSEWPETTWQMFKKRHESTWWLGWLVRRRPVRMTVRQHVVTVDLTRSRLWPEANVVPQSFGRPVIFEQLTERSVRAWDL